MKAALAPFLHGFFAVARALPADAQPFHERFEKFLVDDVVFDD